MLRLGCAKPHYYFSIKLDCGFFLKDIVHWGSNGRSKLQKRFFSEDRVIGWEILFIVSGDYFVRFSLVAAGLGLHLRTIL